MLLLAILNSKEVSYRESNHYQLYLSKISPPNYRKTFFYLKNESPILD